jgi:hypothetical protein
MSWLSIGVGRRYFTSSVLHPPKLARRHYTCFFFFFFFFFYKPTTKTETAFESGTSEGFSALDCSPSFCSTISEDRLGQRQGTSSSGVLRCWTRTPSPLGRSRRVGRRRRITNCPSCVRDSFSPFAFRYFGSDYAWRCTFRPLVLSLCGMMETEAGDALKLWKSIMTG